MSFGLSGKKAKEEEKYMQSTREKQTLKEFKQLLADLVELLRRSTDADTVYMYWVNQARRQFVQETSSTRLDNAVFQDRVAFRNHFLDAYKELEEPVIIQVGEHLAAESLTHYYNEVPVRYLTLIPFINNGQTIAITVLESKFRNMTEEEEQAIRIFQGALTKLLSTYLEVNDLSENQMEWQLYEEAVQRIEAQKQPVKILHQMLAELGDLMQNGGAMLVGRGMNHWCNVLNSGDNSKPTPLGMAMNERSLCYLALKNGSPEFAIHFNNSPKRLGLREQTGEGATLAIPLLMQDRRQAVVIIYDENPLVFKEAVKHKCTNMVRLTGYKLLAGASSAFMQNDLLTNEYGAFIPELWETAIEEELHGLQKGTDLHTWFGIFTLDNLSSIRTKFRLDDLKRLQTTVVETLNPSNFELNGFIGAKTDYVYCFMIQSRNEHAITNWKRALTSREARFLDMGSEPLSVSYKMGYAKLDPRYNDCHDVASAANRAFNEAVKSTRTNVLAE